MKPLLFLSRVVYFSIVSPLIEPHWLTIHIFKIMQLRPHRIQFIITVKTKDTFYWTGTIIRNIILSSICYLSHMYSCYYSFDFPLDSVLLLFVDPQFPRIVHLNFLGINCGKFLWKCSWVLYCIHCIPESIPYTSRFYMIIRREYDI